MEVLIEVGLNIVQPFECDEERSLIRYADQVAEAARELYPDADVTWRIDTRTGFGVRIDGLDDTEALRAEADRIWEDQTWIVDPRAEALGPDAVHVDRHRYRVGNAEWLVLTDNEANVEAAERIRDGIWTIELDRYLDEHLIVPVRELQAKLRDLSTEILLAIVDVDAVVSDEQERRGHWLADYDLEEIKLANGFYGYRIG